MTDKMRKLASDAVWQLCRLLPVQKNKVVFISYGGKGFGGNPKAIALELLKQGRDLDLVWLSRNPDLQLPEGIRLVPFGTPQAVKELSTASVWVDNSRGGAHFKKSEQYYMQTWHGFALKHIERAAQDRLPASYVEQCKKDSSFIDLIVSNSDFMTRVYRDDFWYDGEISLYGSPRNDIFFQKNSKIPAAVRDFFGLPQDQKLLLYAPTFRADFSVDCYALDVENTLKACENRFGGHWTALIRLHPNVSQKSDGLFPYDGSRIVDATAYADMQELLAAVDLLITDYSSSMFDYALQGKPCIQFATDLEAYKKDRNFYFALDQLPFPMAQSNEQLLDVIERYDDEAQQQRWQHFKRENGIVEDGNASQRCAQWILNHTKG